MAYLTGNRLWTAAFYALLLLAAISLLERNVGWTVLIGGLTLLAIGRRLLPIGRPATFATAVGLIVAVGLYWASTGAVWCVGLAVFISSLNAVYFAG